MERGDVFLTAAVAPDPRRRRAYLVVSRAEFLASRYSSAVCIPLYTSASGTPTEVLLDERVGLKQVSFARCDEVTSVQRTRLTTYIGHVHEPKMQEVSRALAIAMEIAAVDLDPTE